VKRGGKNDEEVVPVVKSYINWADRFVLLGYY